MQGVQRSIVNFAIFLDAQAEISGKDIYVYNQSGHKWKDQCCEYKFGVISIEIAFKAMELPDTEISDMCCIVVVQVYI